MPLAATLEVDVVRLLSAKILWNCPGKAAQSDGSYSRIMSGSDRRRGHFRSWWASSAFYAQSANPHER